MGCKSSVHSQGLHHYFSLFYEDQALPPALATLYISVCLKGLKWFLKMTCVAGVTKLIFMLCTFIVSHMAKKREVGRMTKERYSKGKMKALMFDMRHLYGNIFDLDSFREHHIQSMVPHTVRVTAYKPLNFQNKIQTFTCVRQWWELF